MPTRLLRDWTDSEPVNGLSWQEEVFFTRLIMKVDDFGRFSANPKLLNSLLFPLKDGIRDAEISRILTNLQSADLIAVYEVKGKSYLEIKKLGTKPRSIKSKFPSPCEQMQTNVCSMQTNVCDPKANATVFVSECVSVSVSECDREHPRSSGFPTIEQAEQFCKSEGMPESSVELVTPWHLNRESQGWVKNGGAAITNWQADLKSWIYREARGEFAKTPSKTKPAHQSKYADAF